MSTWIKLHDKVGSLPDPSGQTVVLPRDQSGTSHKLRHFVCCVELDRAFCGSHPKGKPGYERAVDCVVCLDIWESLGRCPFAGSCTLEHGPVE